MRLAWGRGEDGQIDALPKDKAEKLVEVIRHGIENGKRVAHQQQPTNQLSIADELAKAAKLKEQGVLTEAEFQQLKQELLKRI